ncbi:heavy metal translocating P-type ATPase [Chondrinema litorale]|uniref:heavy metal translocating P-type ATPase n=1 Tax=Chondrinema litorale TaxID=2994555 RepID=UPI0025434F0D|nr:heavy metal translocating P-type ATPase metal-binding domain-containing protein [Chondrinema litorale]UZR94371.1 heavy metal translocating P-type ATPase metal-binding domain-containing protein [Chondrinema litorale]
MNAFNPELQTKCYHCGDDCGKHPITAHDKLFCCEGCKTVYEILQESNLCNYYQIEKTPGLKNKKSTTQKYAFLDIESIRDEYIHFSNNQITGISFFIPAIHCSSCIWLLENLNKLHDAVLRVIVDFPKKEVTITFKEDQISLRQLAELLEQIGYPPQIDSSPKKNERKKGLPKSFYFKLGIAGFCFGNIMLLSIPEYLGMGAESDTEFVKFFSRLNLLLSLPVFFYSSTEYLISAWKGLKQKFINMDVPISLGIITLFTRSAYEIITSTGAGYMDSLAGLVFFLLVGKWYQQKTYAALSFDRDYASYFPVSVTIVKAGNVHENILLKDLQPGDRALIRNQELIPADAILLKGNAQIDYSFVTGESDPVEKKSGDILYAGGRQSGQAIEIEIKKQVENSYLTKLWNQEIFKKEKETGLTVLADNVGKYFTFFIILLSIGTGAFWYVYQPEMVAIIVTSVLIVACPCALALTIPFTFGNSTRILGKKGIYLKNTNTIETLSKVDTILFDKTGTLTVLDAGKIRYFGKPLTNEYKSIIKSITAHSTHPLSANLNQYLTEVSQLTNFDTYQEESGKGIQATLANNTFKLGSGLYTKAVVENINQNTRVYFAENDEMIGYFEFGNLYRKGFENVMDDLAERYELHLLSGDNSNEKKNLEQFFGSVDHMHFNQSPQNKLDYVKQLQQKGKKVLMVGDGLNDAGALRQSDAGISISDDIYHFSPACDAIMDADAFNQLSKIIKYTKSSYNVVILGFILSFLYNIIGLSFAMTGLLTPLVSAILMPLSSATVVIFATAATYLKGKQTFNN